MPLSLSAVPSVPVTNQEKLHAIRGMALFATIPDSVLSMSIAPIMKEVDFQDGEWIFAKGHLGSSLFVVHAGEVGVFNGAHQLATFRRGEFFGELALLDAEPRSATAVAQGSVVTFRLDQEDFYDVMKKHSEVLHNILRVLCERLRRQNEAMARY